MVQVYNKHRIRNTCYIARKLRNMTYAARKNSTCNQVKKQLFAFCSVGLKLRAISYSSLSSYYRLQTSNSFAYRLMMESGPTTTSVVARRGPAVQPPAPAFTRARAPLHCHSTVDMYIFGVRPLRGHWVWSWRCSSCYINCSLRASLVLYSPHKSTPFVKFLGSLALLVLEVRLVVTTGW